MKRAKRSSASETDLIADVARSHGRELGEAVARVLVARDAIRAAMTGVGPKGLLARADVLLVRWLKGVR
jgi:hypothetical protein